MDGVPVGALTLTSADSTLVRDDELLLLQEIAASLSFAVRSQQHADAAEYLAHYDPLTGLAKRSLFCRRLDDMLRARSAPEYAPTVTVLDIDHLNNFNDSFGRNFGDLLLQQVADGSAGGIRKYFALFHAAHCSRCGSFLKRMRAMLSVMHDKKENVAPDAAMERLRAKIKELDAESTESKT